MARNRAGSNDFDAAVRRFVARHLYGIEQLEILVLMFREPSRYFDPASVAQALELSESQVANDLEAMCRRGLLDVRIASTVLYRFSPATPALALEAEQVVDPYQRRRGALIELLASLNRHRSLKDFSDAFRLKEDPEDG